MAFDVNVVLVSCIYVYACIAASWCGNYWSMLRLTVAVSTVDIEIADIIRRKCCRASPFLE